MYCMIQKVVLRMVGMKTKEVSINISLLFELSFNDFSSWTIARGEGGFKWAIFFLIHTIFRRTTRKGEGEGCLPCSFLKIEKNALILEKKVLIVSILGLNLPFKM